MKSLLLVATVCLASMLMSCPCVAQESEKPAVEIVPRLPDGPSLRNQETPGEIAIQAAPANKAVTPDEPAADGEIADAEWSPKLRIFLTLQAKDKALTNRSSPRGVQYFSRNNFNGGGEGVEVRPAKRVSPPKLTATLACDDIAMSTNTDSDEVEYEFETRGRCRLLLSDLQIDADSMKLGGGILTVTNATTTTQDKTTMHAESMTIPLKPVAVNTSVFGKPVSTLTAPVRIVLNETSRSFSPEISPTPAKSFESQPRSFPDAFQRQ